MLQYRVPSWMTLLACKFFGAKGNSVCQLNRDMENWSHVLWSTKLVMACSALEYDRIWQNIWQ
jgi:hypothetical protein